MDSTPAEAWDAFWNQELEDPLNRRYVQVGSGALIALHWIAPLRTPGRQRLLLTGNGCSLAPYLLARGGFQVSALDISPVASAAVATVEPNLMALLTGAPSRKSAPKTRPGGSVAVVTADVLSWEAEARFDVIYDDRLATLLPPEVCPEIARRYHRWLNPGGICVLHTVNFGGTIGQDVAPVRKPFEDAFLSAGFTECETHPKRMPSPPQKHVFFLHGSG